MGSAGHFPRLLLCAALCAAGLAHAADLPPPPAKAPAAITLYLELVVNEQATGQVVPVVVKDGHYLIDAEVLLPLHVRTPTNEGPVAVDQIAGVKLKYDSINQQLRLSLPPDWLPAQQLGGSTGSARVAAASDQGFLLTYDLFASNLGQEGAYTSLWTEQRWFGNWGVLSNNGVYRHVLSNNGAIATADTNGYLRYDTRLTYSDPDTVRTLIVGDLITGALPWSSSVRIGGVQIARNFGIRPDLVPYPLPSFSGQATVPSAVDLFINGHKAGTDTVQPGPFTLNTLPFINGAGEASVVTTDALGRQVLTTVPFYVANTLLKAGTTDYSAAFGTLRQDYGVKNFSYGQAVANGTLRYGLSDTIVLEGQAQLAANMTVLGAGGVVAVGQLGLVNASLTQSHSDIGQGRQWNLGYQYNGQRYGVGIQRTQRSADFADLGTLGASATNRPSFSSTQANASLSLGDAGTLSAAYFNVLGGDGQRTELMALNYTKPINSFNFLTVNLNDAINTHQYNLLVQWTMLFDTLGSLSITGTRDNNGTGRQVQYSRSAAPSGGLGWNLAYADGSQQAYKQASATWRADNVQVQAGFASQGGRTSNWAGATGSIVVMDGSVFAANRINDAFVVVSTSGIPDIPLKFENQLIGRTNSKGHLLVTGVNAYYPARFEIDTLELPEFMQATLPEQRLVLRGGSGALLRFDIQQILAASMTLVDEAGRPLAVGMFVQHVGSGRTALVGWEGLVYMEGLSRDNELLVRSAGGQSCRVRFTLDASTPMVARLGPQVCRAQTTFADLNIRSGLPLRIATALDI